MEGGGEKGAFWDMRGVGWRVEGKIAFLAFPPLFRQFWFLLLKILGHVSLQAEVSRLLLLLLLCAGLIPRSCIDPPCSDA